MDNDAYRLVKNVWFNSGKLIAEYLKKPENPDLNLGLKIFQTTETGVHEAIEFEDYLLKNKIWDRKVILKGQIIQDLGITMTILSPDTLNLEKLLNEYKFQTGDDIYTAGKEKDWGKTLTEFIEEEVQKKYKFSQDSSVKNGSSITFVITIFGKNFLFLGDSHPILIAKAITDLGFSEIDQLVVELFKVSHHGSKSNTNEKLVKLVKTGNYFLSTDSSGDNHPHKRTLARIVKYNPSATFHFNYPQVSENILLPQDFKDFPLLKIKLTNKLEFKYDPR